MKHISILVPNEAVLASIIDPRTMFTGVNSRGSGFGQRWGDYSQMGVDPADDTTFWFTNHDANYASRIASFSVGSRVIWVDFNAVAAGTDKTHRFVHDDRAVANIIIGPGIPPPALTRKGHFHPESAEFWSILLNKIRYNIEGMPVFEASQGDIVYVPKMRFHLASFGGDGPSCRLAMNGYVDLSHSFDADEAP